LRPAGGPRFNVGPLAKPRWSGEARFPASSNTPGKECRVRLPDQALAFHDQCSARWGFPPRAASVFLGSRVGKLGEFGI